MKANLPLPAIAAAPIAVLIPATALLMLYDGTPISKVMEYVAIAAALLIGGIAALTVFLAGINWLTDKVQANAQAASVTFNGDGISCEGPGERSQRIGWAGLDRVLIQTTDAGPFVPDVFWIFLAKDEHRDPVIIPGEAQGLSDLLSELQSRLTGFDNEVVIAAMGSTDCQVFQVWCRDRNLDHN